MMFHNIQALLDMSQCSCTFRILILFFKICDNGINKLFESVPLFKQLAYTNKTQFSMSQYVSIYKYTQ